MTSIKFRALTHDDHKLFFEALGEHGKDFQNIQQYMAQKGSKSSSKSSTSSSTSDHQSNNNNNNNNKQQNLVDPQDKKEDDKKREQIRNFYNKLYTKLSQLIGKLDDRVEKVNQELYLLINYGEIWKKHGFKFNKKTKKLLEELVHQGYTTLRFKNKNVRLRTPTCKALKKINEIGIDEKVKVVSQRELPKDVIVEFHPATNRDWIRVQSKSQNPRVRAKLSIQKRVFNLVEFLENKWNISQDKLNRTVEAWLKVPPNNNNQFLDDLQSQHLCPPINGNSMNSYENGNLTIGSDRIINNNNIISSSDQTTPNSEIYLRLRLKPSEKHELKEVNITRVVPDNHLDLSLTAYIKRLNESITKNNEQTTSKKDMLGNNNTNIIQSHNVGNLEDGGMMILSENLELSQSAMSSSSRLPISLTTPDSSILLERSSTSDQPSIAQARRHLNLLQTLASFEGCENSRTACEDTQDRSLLDRPLASNVLEQSQYNNQNCNRASSSFGGNSVGRSVSFAEVQSDKSMNYNDSNIIVTNNIPALFNEDAVIDSRLQNIRSQQEEKSNGEQNQQQLINSDSQNSKSVDFNIPKNLTLGDWFKMTNGVRQDRGDGDNANDAFPTEHRDVIENVSNDELEKDKTTAQEVDTTVAECPNKTVTQPTNHTIEIKKLAEGWTRQDESSVTIGELYLAFKCPEKIILDYEFEQYTYHTTNNEQTTSDTIPLSKLEPTNNHQRILTIIPDLPSNDSLIFRLLTAANLSLTQIEQQKQEQPSSRFKRRKGSSNHSNTIKYLNVHDIEATNQRVEEALKQLQPTRLNVYRRTR